MSTNPTRGENNDPPAWLESPKTSRPVDDDEETKSSGTRKAIKVKKSRRSSVGSARSSYGGYDNEDENEEIEEDCCCCPMDPLLFSIAVFHLILASSVSQGWLQISSTYHGHKRPGTIRILYYVHTQQFLCYDCSCRVELEIRYEASGKHRLVGLWRLLLRVHGIANHW